MLPASPSAVSSPAALRSRRIRIAALALSVGFAAAACGVDVGDGTVTAAEDDGGAEDTTTTVEQTTTTAEKTTTTAERTTTTERPTTTTTTRPPTTTTTEPIEVFENEVVDQPTGIRWRMDDVPAAVEMTSLFGPVRLYESKENHVAVMVSGTDGWTYDDLMAQLPAVAPDRSEGKDSWVGTFRAHRFHMPTDDDRKPVVMIFKAVDVGGHLVVVAATTDPDRTVLGDLLVDIVSDTLEVG